MGGYHEAYAITREGSESVCNMDGQYMVYTSMQVAAHNLGVVSKANPGVKYTIRPFKMRLPWTKQGW